MERWLRKKARWSVELRSSRVVGSWDCFGAKWLRVRSEVRNRGKIVPCALVAIWQRAGPGGQHARMFPHAAEAG